MAAETLVEQAPCLHCGLEIPPGPRVFASLGGEEVAMCCIGCRAAAEMLDKSGLRDWYVRRESPSGRSAALPAEVLDRIAYLETEALEDEFVRKGEEDTSAVQLLVDELRCAACVWAIERYLGSLEGVVSVRVLLESRRVHVSWVGDRLRLKDVIARLAEIGFAARPDRPGAEADRDRRESRAALIRLGIAGLGAMNVMTYSVALYVGGFDGMSSGSQALMRWMGWIVATPIVAISARPFFVGAWRDLRRRRPGMDVPVALAIGGAYAVSAFATVRGIGEVYFDSVCMFTFFLTLGRYLERRVEAEGASFVRDLTDATPLLARRLGPDEATAGAPETVVPAHSLRARDRVRVLSGELIPVDGVVISGTSAVDEALLTGEPWPRSIGVGDSSIAGSLNIDEPLVLEAVRVGEETKLAGIMSLVEQAVSARAPVARLADRVAAYFVTTVLGFALINWMVWSVIAPERAVWTTLSVLVATCPCALSLAMPMAIRSASQGLARAGFLIANPSALEDLANIDRVIFDKTGTLTEGAPAIARVVACSATSEHDVTELAAALEQESTHPIARAFHPGRKSLRELGRGSSESGGRTTRSSLSAPIHVVRRRNVVGAGVEGWIDGNRYRIGRPDWAGGAATASRPISTDIGGEFIWILLSVDEEPLAWFGLVDPVRAHATEAVEELRSRGLEVEVLSGDPSESLPVLARKLGLVIDRAGASPEEKLDRVRFLQQSGERVALVGDGVNDSPSLRASDVSIAMGSGCDLSRLNADAVLLADDLSILPEVHEWAKRTRRVIGQNLAWAIGYNLLALPLAFTGTLSPWMAALGMSSSSLLVVTNAKRLKRRLA